MIKALAEEHKVAIGAFAEKVHPAQRRQEEAITPLCLAMGFVLGLRLSGAGEEKIKSLMNTDSFGLSEPEEIRITSRSEDGAGTS